MAMECACESFYENSGQVWLPGNFVPLSENESIYFFRYPFNPLSCCFVSHHILLTIPNTTIRSFITYLVSKINCLAPLVRSSLRIAFLFFSSIYSFLSFIFWAISALLVLIACSSLRVSISFWASCCLNREAAAWMSALLILDFLSFTFSLLCLAFADALAALLNWMGASLESD